MIRLENVTKTFPPDRTVLSDINLEVSPGEWVWLLGETGIGKSVLLKVIYGALDPDEGSVSVLENDVPSLSEKNLARLRRRMGIVFQDVRLFDHRTSFDNIYLVLRALGIKKEEAWQQTEHWLARLGIADLSSRLPYELSLGQRQKVSLARALAKEPELLVLDEPFSALDEKKERDMLKLLGEVNHAGTTILAASHEHEVLHFLPGRVLQLRAEGLS
jgi:cell division transport system ATP-binding protein